jgi:hypothetical protein
MKKGLILLRRWVFNEKPREICHNSNYGKNGGAESTTQKRFNQQLQIISRFYLKSLKGASTTRLSSVEFPPPLLLEECL